MKKTMSKVFLLGFLISGLLVSCVQPTTNNNNSSTPSNSEESNDFKGTWRGSTFYDNSSYDYILEVGNSNIQGTLTIDFNDVLNFSFQQYSIDGITVSAIYAGDTVRIGKLSGSSFKFNSFEDISIPPCTLYKD